MKRTEEILELQNTMTNIENFSNKLDHQKKEAANMKTNYLLTIRGTKRKRMKKSEDSLHELWDTINHGGLRKRREKERGEKMI